MADKRVRILLADDDIELLQIVKRKLGEQKRYELLEANNGEEALTLVLEEHPDLIVLDVMMPNLNGWEVCKYVKTKPELDDIGVIMLTAIGPNLNELTSPLYGADDYLDKPFNFTELEAKIEKVLRDRGKL